MSGYFTYLISSLPMLYFGQKPPFSFKKFITICQSFISQEDIDILNKASITGEYDYKITQPTLQKWNEFDIAFRNELVKMRASRKHKDPAKYLRRDGYADPHITHIARNAFRNPSILEAEKTLDMERWKVLDELALGHYFDLDFLVVYAHKLLILERWQNITAADSRGKLEEVLKACGV